ncbi:hypothetical protein HTS88_21575 [Pseudarthrobacter oxydans]|uniref:hypothetical protein n=1 Tax=Pseudarthrobacter oxydans TaxID=1671 RepID=UPI001572D658|nr:hypothetical protein [Pseudarthrobacter oxydans]NSX38969.1 hypothetical protein [Pseudarthrobacter oxydans]
MRSLQEVIDAVSVEITANRIGVRISASSSCTDVFDPDKRSLYWALVPAPTDEAWHTFTWLNQGLGSLDAVSDGRKVSHFVG